MGLPSGHDKISSGESMLRVPGSGFRVYCFGRRVGVADSGCIVPGFVFGFRISDFGLRVAGVLLQVSDLISNFVRFIFELVLPSAHEDSSRSERSESKRSKRNGVLSWCVVLNQHSNSIFQHYE